MIGIEDRIPNSKNKEVYHRIRLQGTVSKVQLTKESSMTPSTLNRTLEDLLAYGWIKEVGYGESTGGRRPILYQIHANNGYVFGFDISRTSMKLLLCDMNLITLEERSWIMNERSTPQWMLEELTAAVESMMAKHHVPQDRVIGMGIGAVGPLNRITGKILSPEHFPASGWLDVGLVKILENHFTFPVRLDNGVNNALLAEHHFDKSEGKEKEAKHLLYIHVGVGLRSAMMSDGKIVYGAVDMEGAAGQMIIDTDGVPHRDAKGNKGALESYVTIPVLEQQFRQAHNPNTRDEKISFAHMVSALRQGDALAVQLFEQAAFYLGIGLANWLNILHPEKVILGGPLIQAHQLVFDTVKRTALDRVYYYPIYNVSFSKGLLGDDAMALGAAAMIINEL